MNKFGIVFFLWVSLWLSGNSDVIIQFEPRAYLYSQVRDKIEHDTPYDIELPYVDDARQKKFMPASLSLNECLNWIVAYFEEENQLTLNYTFEQHRVIFQKASSLSKDEQKIILDRKLNLKGKSWSIGDAIQAAGQQASIQISMPFRDEKNILADYNYNCTLGEFIEEVKLYWIREMGYRIHAIIESQTIDFYKGGEMIKNNTHQNKLLENLKPVSNSELSKDRQP